MYEKQIPYNFTIQVYFAFFVQCQKCVFDNLEHIPYISYIIFFFFKKIDGFKILTYKIKEMSIIDQPFE